MKPENETGKERRKQKRKEMKIKWSKMMKMKGKKNERSLVMKTRKQ